MDSTNAVSWGIYNTRKGFWHNEIVKNLGLPKNVLPLVAGEKKKTKKITPEIAEITGLPENTLICRGEKDWTAGRDNIKMETRVPLHREEAAYGAILNAAVELGFADSHQDAGRLVKYIQPRAQ